MHDFLRNLTLAMLPFLATPALARQCPEWSPEFSTPGADGPVRTQEVLPLGGVDRLVIGGDFLFVGETRTGPVAAWDGAQWSAVAPEAPGPVQALALYDDGAGDALYAGGKGFLARWTGVAWESFAVSGEVFALHVHDDGGGPVLFVGGQLSQVEGMVVRGLARYDGAWSNLNGGLGNSNGDVRALETHDDGSGPALHVGGTFQSVGGVQARCLARWDGGTFVEVGGGLDGGSGHATKVRALAAYTPPGGVAELHVGGQFTGAGGVQTSRWIAWRQGAWADVGGDELVTSFAVRAEPLADVLCAARETGVERWDGATRDALPLARPVETLSLGAFGPGAPQELLLGTLEASEAGSCLARWSGAGWEALFDGLGLAGAVGALGVHDFGQGEELVAVSPVRMNGADFGLRYDGAGWTSLGPDETLAGAYVRDLHSHAGDLYVAGGAAGAYVLRREAGGWSPLGQAGSGWATGLETFDAGSGPELHVCGYVSSFGTPDTAGIARWNGAEWVDVGGGLTGPVGITQKHANGMVAWNDGTGPALYVGGSFIEAGGTPAISIARWDGSAWAEVGGGISSQTVNPTVFGLVTYQSPVGERLVVTGAFDAAGGVPASGIAAWDGSAWTALGSGLELEGNTGHGLTILAHDPDGLGERLYVIGGFDAAGGVPVEGTAVWDGTSWAATSLPFTSQARMEVYDDGEGRALFVGGGFKEAGGVGAHNVAKLTDPCGDALGYPVCASVPNSTGLAAIVRASGSAHVSAMNLTLTARNLPPNTLTLFFDATAEVRKTTGDGVLCVGGNLLRMYPAGFSNGAGEISKVFDFQAPYAANVLAGESLYFQGFLRDLAGGPAGFNTTDALRVLIRP